MRRVCLLLLPGVCVFAGCVGEEGAKGLPLVSGNPFSAPPPALGSGRLQAPSASNETSVKVDFVGRKLIAANGQIGMRPYFLTLGLPTLEIFHLENRAVYVTEGLVKKCKTEDELAAVLANELGKMVAEREILAAEDWRNPERQPPINVPIGNAGQNNGADRTSFVEMVKHEFENPRKPRATPRPNPANLAGIYLDKAGYPRTSLTDAQPLLEEADRNCAVERQFKGLPPKGGWTP